MNKREFDQILSGDVKIKEIPKYNYIIKQRFLLPSM